MAPKIKDFDIEESYGGNLVDLQMTSEDGEYLGHGAFQIKRGYPISHVDRVFADIAQVRKTEVNGKYYRQGLGTKLYEKMAAIAKEKGAKLLCSDSRLSPDAIGFWEKQSRKGRIVHSGVEGITGQRFSCVSLEVPIDLSGTKRKARRKRRK